MSNPTPSSTAVRAQMVEAVELDLIGPGNDHAFAHELLPEPPHRWYLTGFLVPTDAPIEQRMDDQASEDVDAAGDAKGVDDGTPPDAAAARHSALPSSLGLSVFVAAGVEELQAVVRWGDYQFAGMAKDSDPGIFEEAEAAPEESAAPESIEVAEPPAEAPRHRKAWRRVPREATVAVPLRERRKAEVVVPGSGGLKLFVVARTVSDQVADTGRIPRGTRSVTVFLVNYREPAAEPRLAYRTYVYQAQLALKSEVPFVPRPDLRGAVMAGSPGGGVGRLSDDWDYRLGDLQYRDVVEYAVGHAVSARHELGADGACRTVESAWIPGAHVERVSPSRIAGVELRMEALGALADGADAAARLMPLVTQYREWIERESRKAATLSEQRRETAEDLRLDALNAAGRIEAGIRLLADPATLDAFRVMNRAMAAQARQRVGQITGKTPSAVDPPTWRPFQLAFILMSLRGIVDPAHADRETVDLLFFPTGGGKTEAYLGLAAFTMVLRRLRNPGIASAGVTVLMRYTLRLLTLDQLGRASALICALELEREKTKDKLGEWPFEIGLWVGQAATPNRMGGKGYDGPGKEHTAYTKTIRFRTQSGRSPSPIPMESCPWCGTKFTPESFRLEPNSNHPTDLRVHCASHRCEFNGGDRHLPIVAVDEPIYRRLPAFLIATVDKFAALPWIGEVGALFGLVDRHDRNGFYGPTKPAAGAALPNGRLLPPDLVIQDELHLISGPLGTVAGLYEVAIDALATRPVDGKQVRPKIVASTATVRRAESQIRALFERTGAVVFPTPGVDRRDSFFAHTDSPDTSPARQYIGVSAQGRSPKTILLRTVLALLSSGQRLYDDAGGSRNKSNPADPYMTLLSYFNSLRELGGSRRIVEDEVRTRVAEYARRKRLDPQDGLFANRTIDYEVMELTSRVSTNEVAEAKERLSKPFHEDRRVHVALATNMISVGLDITRLGLMVVFGQPKTTSEYIQATSRVGRDEKKPGLVVTILNVHKPRDRSHYERFTMFHECFYRSVEATSVTPFSPRALDRALPAVLVGLCRHGNGGMTPPTGATEILRLRADLEVFAKRIAKRAGSHRHVSDAETQEIYGKTLERCRRLLDDWLKIAKGLQDKSTHLQYQSEVGNAARLLYDFLDPDLRTILDIRRKFRASRSMRDVEASVDLNVRHLNDWGSAS